MQDTYIDFSSADRSYRLDLQTQELYCEKRGPVHLPPRVWDLLVFFINREPRRLITKDVLMNTLWKGTYISDGFLTETVAMLRKALGDSRTDPRFIETVHGRGYRFIATVNRFSNDGDNGIDALSETSSLLLSMRASRANLTDTQRRAKQKLNDIAKDIHRSQMMELSHDNVLKVNDFHSVWETLFTQMFESNQNLSHFTISSDALHRFQAYEFGRYYHRLFELQREHLSKSKIRIMMLCHKFETDGSDLVKDALAYATSLVFEQAVKTILERCCKNTKFWSGYNPGDAYRELANESHDIYGFRLINRYHISMLPAESMNMPFNIYGKFASSRSIIPSLHDIDWAPIPCLEVSFNTDVIMKQQQFFNEAWNKASLHIDTFANTMTDWDMFGRGELMKKWVDIGL